jgi:hypothetical protein
MMTGSFPDTERGVSTEGVMDIDKPLSTGDNIIPDRDRRVSTSGFLDTERGRGTGGFPYTEKGGRTSGFPDTERGGRTRGFLYSERGGRTSGFLDSERGVSTGGFPNTERGGRTRGFPDTERGGRTSGFLDSERGGRTGGFPDTERGGRAGGFLDTERRGRTSDFPDTERGGRADGFLDTERRGRTSDFPDTERGVSTGGFPDTERGGRTSGFLDKERGGRTSGFLDTEREGRTSGFLDLDNPLLTGDVPDRDRRVSTGDFPHRKRQVMTGGFQNIERLGFSGDEFEGTMRKRRPLPLPPKYRGVGDADIDSGSNHMCCNDDNDDDDIDWIPEENVSDSNDSSIWKGVGVESLDMSSIIEDKSSTDRNPGVILQVSHQISNGKRNNKFNCCLFCGKYNSRISRHYTECHGSEIEVAKILSYPKLSAERRRLWSKLVNRGNYEHNFQVLQEGKGVVVPKYRPRKKEDKEPTCYIPCQYCFGTYVKEDLWKHQRRCPFNDSNSLKCSAVQSGKLLLPIIGERRDFYESILLKMREDEVKAAVQSDTLILSLGYRLFEKVCKAEHQHQYVSQRLRELGRLLIALRKEHPDIRNIKNAIKPQNWEALIKGVRNVAGYETDTVNIPSLPLKIGHSLSKCAHICRAEALIEGNNDNLQEADRFLSLYDSEWEHRISSRALSVLHTAKFNKPKYVPLAEDVKLLFEYLQHEANVYAKHIDKKTDVENNYCNLVEITLALLILFNRKRSGEAQRMTVKDFKDGSQNNTLDEDVKNSLSKFEQELCATHTRIEMKGKRGKKVAVLLIKSVQENINRILNMHSILGINSIYIFMKPKTSYPVRGADCLRKYAKACGAKFPEALTSTHLATMTQILGLSEGNQDIIAKFMGHDIRIHRDFYRLPENTVEMAKVAKIMYLINTGRIHKYKGKDFDEIEFNHTGIFSISQTNLYRILRTFFFHSPSKW